MHVAYELHVTNFYQSSGPLHLKRLTQSSSRVKFSRAALLA
ncbi:MAG: hypothetical protein ABI887_15880 [Burkholderiales bacterium]